MLRLTRANAPYATAEGARRRVRERTLRPARYGPPRRLRRDVTIEVTREQDWPIYTLTPRHRVAEGCVVYLHGGGWVHEIVRQHWQLAAQIAAEAATRVLVPIYPLLPAGTAADVVPRVADLTEHTLNRYGAGCLAGDSAGGQIVLSTALVLRDRGRSLARTVLISPVLDLTFANPRIPLVQPLDPWLATPGARVLADLWCAGLELTDPLASPLHGRFEGLGPLTIVTGSHDILNPDAHLLAETARAAGVDVTLREEVGQVHVHPLLPTAAGRAARAQIVAEIAAATSAGGRVR